MPFILPIKTQARWIVQRAGKTILDGVTIVRNATGVDPTCTVISGEGDAEFLKAAKDKAGTYNPLPAPGEWCEADALYSHKNSFVVCRKSHLRTDKEPADAPDLFVVNREIAEEPVIVKATEIASEEAPRLGKCGHCGNIVYDIGTCPHCGAPIPATLVKPKRARKARK